MPSMGVLLCPSCGYCMQATHDHFCPRCTELNLRLYYAEHATPPPPAQRTLATARQEYAQAGIPFAPRPQVPFGADTRLRQERTP